MIQKIYNERKIAAKFVAVGAIGFVVNYVILRFVNSELSVDKIVSEIIAALIALQVTFVLNDKWTYALNEKVATLRLSIWQRYIAYLATNSFGSLMTILMFAIFSNYFDRLIALGISAFAAMIWNYIMNLVFIWRRSNRQKSNQIVE